MRLTKGTEAKSNTRQLSNLKRYVPANRQQERKAKQTDIQQREREQHTNAKQQNAQRSYP